MSKDEPPREPRPRASLSPFSTRVLRASVAAFCVLLVAMLADVLLGLTLPQPLRSLLPLALAVSLCVALVIGVAAYGAPQRPAGAPEAEGEPPR